MLRFIFLLLALLLSALPATTFARDYDTGRWTAPYNTPHQYGGEGEGYVNSNGEHVHVPLQTGSQPAEATAKCRDGSWSFSRNHRGTCSYNLLNNCNLRCCTSMTD